MQVLSLGEGQTSDLLYTTTDFPAAELRRRAALTRAPAEDSPLSFDNLPDEVWRKVMRDCDHKSLANLRMVSKRTRALTEEAVPGVQHFTGPTPKAAVRNAITSLAPAPTIVRFASEARGFDFPASVHTKVAKGPPTFKTSAGLSGFLLQTVPCQYFLRPSGGFNITPTPECLTKKEGSEARTTPTPSPTTTETAPTTCASLSVSAANSNTTPPPPFSGMEEAEELVVVSQIDDTYTTSSYTTLAEGAAADNTQFAKGEASLKVHTHTTTTCVLAEGTATTHNTHAMGEASLKVHTHTHTNTPTCALAEGAATTHNTHATGEACKVRTYTHTTTTATTTAVGSSTCVSTTHRTCFYHPQYSGQGHTQGAAAD